jgi:N-acetylglucosamine-6-phosphate deacetylase
MLARRYDSGEPVRVTFSGGLLASIEPIWTRESLVDWPWIAPAFFDLQINGYGGVWFSDERLTADQVLEVLEGYRTHGVTQLFPTLITNSHEALVHGFATIRAACDRETWADSMVAGCHLEGPFISPEDGPRGAHPAAYVRVCDWNEFAKLNSASGGRIRLVTVAPESTGAEDFIRRAVANHVTVALGHTSANSGQVQSAVNAGAKLSTHLGNGAHPVLKRHPNYIWDQLGEPRLWASVISDGHHLPESVLRSIVAAKTVERTIITCDASGLAGCEPGFYSTPFGKFEVLADGRIIVAGQQTLLAGSALTTEVCVARMIRATGVSLRTACDMAGRVPAALFNVDKTPLIPGRIANHILFDWQPVDAVISIREVYSASRQDVALKMEATRSSSSRG